jgi:MOSC domain-containing protein YiiM
VNGPFHPPVIGEYACSIKGIVKHQLLGILSLPVGTRISVGGEATLEITQIGKECHVGCDIYQKIGKCIMPQEGVFARVIQGGPVGRGHNKDIGLD